MLFFCFDPIVLIPHYYIIYPFTPFHNPLQGVGEVHTVLRKGLQTLWWGFVNLWMFFECLMYNAKNETKGFVR